MNYFVYVIQCSDKSFYTGYTNDLKKRMEAHKLGRGSKYVWSRKPFKVVYKEKFETQHKAMQREYEIKQMSRKEKETLILSLKKKSGLQ